MLYLSEIYGRRQAARLTAVPLSDRWQPVKCLYRQIGNHAIYHMEAESTFRRLHWPPGQLMTGYVHQAGPDTRIWGEPASAGMMFTMAAPANNDFVMDRGTQVSAIITPLETFSGARTQVQVTALTLDRRPRVSFAPPGAAALAPDYERLRLSLVEQGGAHGWDSASVLALLEAHVESAFGAQARLARADARMQSRFQMFRSGEQFMLDNMHREIYLGEMAHAIGTCERNLRYAFDDMVGVSPIEYLSRLRLSAAHRALQEAKPDRTSVSAIALKFGLWDLSRFARNYARLFDTMPKDVLLRGPEALPGILMRV